MRSHTLASIVVTMSALACGGSDGSSFTAAADDGGPDATSGDSALGGPEGGGDGATRADGGATDAPADGARPGDGAASDAPIPDGGAPPNPGTVGCGTTTCTAPQFCCAHVDGGFTCETSGGA